MQVHYTGILDDGTEFDSSRGKDPLEFVIGAGTVIKGFDLAVMGLRLGEHRKHAVQPADGYGAALTQCTCMQTFFKCKQAGFSLILTDHQA